MDATKKMWKIRWKNLNDNDLSVYTHWHYTIKSSKITELFEISYVNEADWIGQCIAVSLVKSKNAHARKMDQKYMLISPFVRTVQLQEFGNMSFIFQEPSHLGIKS